MRGPDSVFTPALKRRFLDELARHGNVRVAAARCGVSRSGVYLARSRDPAFGRAWQAALVLGRDGAAEALAERATQGWLEPVFYRGARVGARRRFDGRLLLAHLAWTRPILPLDPVQCVQCRPAPSLLQSG